MSDCSGAAERLVDRYLRHLAIEKGRSANTIAAYRRDLEGYLDFLRERGADPASVSPQTVTDFQVSLRSPERNLAVSSIARTLSSVRGFHRFLVIEGVTDRDPSAEIAPPKLPSKLPKAVSIDEMGRMLDAFSGDDPVAIRNRALLELLYATGARVSEAVALNVDDVSGIGEERDVVRLFGKGGKERIVPVGSYARRALDDYLVRVRPLFSARGRSTPALFLGSRGSRLSRQGAWLVIRAAAERAEIGVDVSPHTFRHSFATHLLQGGADVRVVQELLGHASVQTTQIYTLVTADTLRDVYATAHPRAR